MTAFPSYSTGTVSVANGATAIVGSGTIWSGVNVRPGDDIVIDGHTVIVQDVTDTTHLVIDAWPYTSVAAGASYKVVQRSPLRFAGGQAMADVSALVAALNTDGFYVFVSPSLTEPDPSYGDENQFALQPDTGKLWLKTGGVWVFQGIYKGFSIKGAWSSAAAYVVGDVVSLAGSSYVALAPSTNQTPPNLTYWQVLAAAGTAATIAAGTTTTGAPGTNASVSNSGTSLAAVFDFTIPSGKGYGGTSTTSLAIGTGSKIFNGIGTGYAYAVGNYVRASSAAGGANFMEGFVTAYSGGNITINVTNKGGSGTFANWSLSIAGDPGDVGVASLNGQTGALASYFPPQGRVTLTSGAPVMLSGTAGATTVYYTPYAGNLVPIYNGANMVPTAFSELSQATTDTTKSPAACAANANYDLFVWNDSGTIRCSRGPAWTDALNRSAGTALVSVNGILLNSASITNGPAAQRGTYVGTIRTNGSSTIDYLVGGVGSGGVAAVMNIWNAYNQRPAVAEVRDNGVAFNYQTLATQLYRASPGNQISFVVGLQANGIHAHMIATILPPATAGAAAIIGIGYDDTANFYNDGRLHGFVTTAQVLIAAQDDMQNVPAIGAHTLSMLQRGDGTNNTAYNQGNKSAILTATIWN
jgi:hypothetical protein